MSCTKTNTTNSRALKKFSKGSESAILMKLRLKSDRYLSKVPEATVHFLKNSTRHFHRCYNTFRITKIYNL